MSSEELKPIAELAKRDGRYKLDAYLFVQGALRYAQEELGMGATEPYDDLDDDLANDLEPDDLDDDLIDEAFEPFHNIEAHLTGQELCEAARILASRLYGRLAKVVLNSWGVYRTRDFGEIVFNLIEIKQMTKSDTDRVEDFDDVYDFEDAFNRRYEIKLHDEPL